MPTNFIHPRLLSRCFWRMKRTSKISMENSWPEHCKLSLNATNCVSKYWVIHHFPCEDAGFVSPQMREVRDENVTSQLRSRALQIICFHSIHRLSLNQGRYSYERGANIWLFCSYKSVVKDKEGALVGITQII